MHILGRPKLYPVIVNAKLTSGQLEDLLTVLKKHKKALGWTIKYLVGIDASYCTHRILHEDHYKTTRIPQRRLNPMLKEVVYKEILKWLDAGIIYSISDSEWISPLHVVPKKGGVTVIENEEGKLVPTRTNTG